MKDAIIIDLDGTLADCQHRRHHAENKDFKTFYKEIPKDPVNAWCKTIMNMFKANGYAVIILTGREGTNEIKQMTAKWLNDNAPIKTHYDHLYYRAEKDYRPDHEVKLDLYNKHVKPFYNVLFIIDDRTSVVKMWRDQGLTTLQCCEGNF